MKTNLKPANSKARALLNKLQALAEQGIDGEKISARDKIARLIARFDFTLPDPAETPDLVSGNFKRSTKARWIYSFGGHEFDVANSWPPCPSLYRGVESLETNPVLRAGGTNHR